MAVPSSSDIKQRVLVLEPNSTELANNLLPDCQYEVIGGNPLKPLKKYHFQYDYVFSFHVLQLAWNQDTEIVLTGWHKCLRPGGKLYIFVPAMEWAVENYNVDDQPKHLWHHIHGWENNKPHLASFDMKLLRASCDRAGLLVVDAQMGMYGKQIEGVEYTAGQHFISIFKPGPEEAIVAASNQD